MRTFKSEDVEDMLLRQFSQELTACLDQCQPLDLGAVLARVCDPADPSPGTIQLFATISGLLADFRDMQKVDASQALADQIRFAVKKEIENAISATETALEQEENLQLAVTEELLDRLLVELGSANELT